MTIRTLVSHSKLAVNPDLPDALRVRREAFAFVTEERSIGTGRPPYDIAAVTAPLVFGSSGMRRFTAVSDHLRRLLGDVETVVIPGGGHNAHRTAPETFAELVRRGVSRAAGRRS